MMSTDSIKTVDYAVFSVNTDTFFVYNGREYTGFIQNRDSMLYGTKLDSVVPVITTSSIVSTMILADSITYTATDTVNFTKPVSLKVFAQNADTTQYYLIKANVHQIDHELYLWEERSYPRATGLISAERALLVDGQLMLYRTVGGVATLHVSADRATTDAWDERTLVGLPAAAVGTVMNDRGVFYAASGNSVYSSTDGVNWAQVVFTGAPLSALLFETAKGLFALAGSEVVMSTDGGASWESVYSCAEGFPVQGYSVVKDKAPSGKMRYLLVGGLSSTGGAAQVWSTEDGRYWVNFSQEGSAKPSRTNAAVVSYDHNLLLFGGMESGSISSEVLLSPDFGLNWVAADAKILPTVFTPTVGASIMVDDAWRIYIVGGRGADGAYSQKIYSARKNETYFEEYR